MDLNFFILMRSRLPRAAGEFDRRRAVGLIMYIGLSAEGMEEDMIT